MKNSNYNKYWTKIEEMLKISNGIHTTDHLFFCSKRMHIKTTVNIRRPRPEENDTEYIMTKIISNLEKW